MATVKEELDRMKGWPTDEPVFVLRGQDLLAPLVVQDWIQRFMQGLSPAPPTTEQSKKYREAMRVAEEMQKWPNRKFPD